MVLSIAVPIFMFLEAEPNLYIVVELLFFEYSHLLLLVLICILLVVAICDVSQQNILPLNCRG